MSINNKVSSNLYKGLDAKEGVMLDIFNYIRNMSIQDSFTILSILIFISAVIMHFFKGD